MADFCWQCCEEILGIDGPKNDLQGLTSAESTANGLFAEVICEGCGFTLVDHDGRCVGGCSEKLHRQGEEVPP